MTDLDEGLMEFQNLVSLNLSGNFIEKLDTKLVPASVRSIELQANGIRKVEGFVENLSPDLLYLGLARNLLNDGRIIQKKNIYLEIFFPKNMNSLKISYRCCWRLGTTASSHFGARPL